MISIVTPTFPGREGVLLTRCIPSVPYEIPINPQWGTSPNVEHIIVSDRNPELRKIVRALRGQQNRRDLGHLRFVEINESWRNPETEASVGAVPWHTGSLLALGKYVGFLGDDDEFLEGHIERHLATMWETRADFTVSEVEFRVNNVPQFVVGDDSFALGHVDSDGIMCRVECLKVANWDYRHHAPDHGLVQDWLKAGLKGAIVPGGPTAIHHDGWAAGSTGRPDRPR